jgi:hypothetical protein
MSSPPDRLSHEAPEPPVRTRKPRPRRPDEPDDTAAEPRPLEPDEDLPGAVFMVPNRQWGFESLVSDDHPGACLHGQAADRDAVLVKGTDADHVRVPRRYHVVAPTPDNGLQKPTAFELVPRYVRLHRLRLFYPERYLGRLDADALLALRDELARVCAGR